jgi:RNA polymerase sigma-70 factor (ECF subfamily)
MDVSAQEDLYREATQTYGAMLQRLARAYESDPDKRRDLLQDIHLALWLSLEKYEARCSLQTWVYRVAHNTATSHVIRQHRTNSRELFSLEQIEAMADGADPARDAGDRMAIERLFELIHQLKPLERDVMLLYLEDLDAASIAEITGISAVHVRVQIHRIKAILTRRFQRGGHS